MRHVKDGFFSVKKRPRILLHPKLRYTTQVNIISLKDSAAEWKFLGEKNSSATQQMRLGRQCTKYWENCRGSLGCMAQDDWACWLNYRRRPWEAGNTFKFNHLKDIFITWNMELLSLSAEFSMDTELLYAQDSQASRPASYSLIQCLTGADTQAKASCQFPAGLLSSLQILIPDHSPSRLRNPGILSTASTCWLN